MVFKMQLIGKVKFFDKKKGFGFVTVGNQDYFAHIKAVKTGEKDLIEGQQVQFIPSEGTKGPIAREIHTIEPDGNTL